MVSVLRTLQAEWNELVPQAERLGIRRVRTLNLPLERIDYRRTKLEWLRGEIARLSATTSLTPAAATDLSVLTFGVEIEFIIGDLSRDELARRINAAGVSCRSEGYNHNVTSAWKIVTDASVDSSYSRGFELVSPVLRGDNGFLQTKKVCDVLKATGCKVNKKCGLHVHVGAGDWSLDTFKNLVLLYGSAEKAIDSFMSPSRRESQNGYCKSLNMNAARAASLLRGHDMADIARAINQTPGAGNARGTGRYCKVNLQSFWQHGTVEFRHHQGTVEADKTLNWVRLCLRMCLAAREGTRAAETFDALFDAVKADPAEKSFFQSRVDFFAGQLNRTLRADMLARARREGTVADVAAAGARTYRIERLTDINGNIRERRVFEDAGTDLQTRATTRNQY